MSIAQTDRQRRPSRAIQRLRTIRRTTLARRVTQLGFAIFIVAAAARHQFESETGTASVDALCPFGAVETLITWATTGTLIAKVHPSNLILGVAVLVAALLVGNAFCGWICPMGTVQDGLAWVAKKLHLPQWQPGPRTDRVLRWGRFVVLGLVMWMSYVTGRLWFADYDPYFTLFSLHWLNPWTEALIVSVAITTAILVASLFVERLWCRYLCPLGAVFAVLGRFSFLRIRRDAATCTDCNLCDRPCPVGITVSKADPVVNADCIGCLDCVTTCPVRGALTISPPGGLPQLLISGKKVEAEEPAMSGKAER
ncbi:MAG: 4Fe-4S binding protein [Propionicimonas sp.]|uniref:4Fe-4S binding protein n=1 Tax=Propionicimonas sp. TaxID=1955623 RepID=UPI001DA73487|nr:4Fe-4S binding protein [Propionicimonas sp.]MBU4188087.1 4Fe-4S binding protein [Actinomycetota bacterium]MBU4206297.1 4Fe-4S binding protein [Actinomycetota bacterium]MBU4250532.1 4Fe-4S binding protein [Actinomycetota bacterium]MBU4364525.1 4Fe-4S binding protein [Actinomycetota bacterium]MBU4409781.1 4Fe-4S binding protein [Actinomycetota bacterium]